MRTAALLFAACAAFAPDIRAQSADATLFVDVRQGTNLSATTEPGLDTIVVELLGRLWRMPLDGGAALPISGVDGAVRHPRFSADGTQIVYQRLVDHSWDIWLLDLATEQHVAVTAAPGNEIEPDFLPAGGGIVFAADLSGSYDLWSVVDPLAQWQPLTSEPGDARFPDASENGAVTYVVRDTDADSLNVRAGGLTSTVYRSAHLLSAPSWRPGGGVIVFTERAAGEQARLLMAILAPDLLLRELAAGEDLFDSRVSWLNSGNFIYAADGQIWRRTLAGSTRRPVHLFATAMISRPEAARLSLDSSALDTALERDTAAEDQVSVYAESGDIWLNEAGEARQLTRGSAWDTEPVLDPQQRFVVFARNHAGERRLYRMLLDDPLSPQALTPAGVRVFAPALDPDGEKLAWLASEGGFSPWAPARLNTLHFEDGTRRRSSVVLRAQQAPQWLADNRVASISVDTLQADGSARALAFDVTLRALAAATSPAPGGSESAQRVVVAAPQADSPTPNRYVIQAGRLFDGVGIDYQRHVDIHIEGDRITAVVARGREPLPETVIDASDLTIMPGLINLHTHDLSLLGELSGRAWLAFGVTTVRSLGPHSDTQRAIAAAWNSGQLAGPRFIAADSVAPPGGASDNLLQPPSLIDDPFVTLPGEPPVVNLPASLLPLRPAAQTTGFVRRYSPGFAHYQDVYALLAAAGATEITSLGVFAPGALARMLRSDAAAGRLYEQLFNPRDRAGWRSAGPLIDALQPRQDSLARLLRAGGRLAIGSEAPQLPPGLGTHIELRLLAEAGVPNDQVLRVATAGGALAIGLERQIGSVEMGRLADLIVVAGDPLSDIADATAIRAVVRGGRWYERDALVIPPDDSD